MLGLTHGDEEEDARLVLELEDVDDFGLGCGGEFLPPVALARGGTLRSDARAVGAADVVRGQEEEAQGPSHDHDHHEGNVGRVADCAGLDALEAEVCE